MSLVGSRVGRFEIIAEIGSGGMASVYLARATSTSGRSNFRRLHAIKVMHPHLSQDEQFVDMFLDEARVAATIHHPNVVPILDVGNDDGLIYLVMDYIEGDSLSNVEKVAINLRRRIPIGITLRVMLDALAGLHYAHELTTPDGTHLKIVHRDVSPQNIVISVDGTSRIVDFGIAKAESRVTTTKVGMIKGKLNFMAPEQLRSGQLDRRVDIFGLGVTLWEAVTLRRLYAGESDFETARRILAGEYPALQDFDPKLPPALDEVCRTALHPDAAQRWQTCAEFADAIESKLRGHIASPRDVATFIQGVAQQKLENERRAVRESVNTDVNEADYLGATVVETAKPARGGYEAHSSPDAILPNTGAPRVQSGESSGTRRASKVRSPTLAMPSPSSPSRRAPSTPEPAVAHEVYDDDGATEVISRRAALKGQISAPVRPVATTAPPPPAPEVENRDLDEVANRTMFEPNISAIRAGIVTRSSQPDMPAPPAPMSDPSVFDPPPEPTQAIDLVTRAPGEGGASHPMPPLGSQPGPQAVPPGSGPYGAMPYAQHAPPPAPLPGMAQGYGQLAPVAPAAPQRTSPWIYVFVAVSVSCLVATVVVVMLRG
ncbi:MAG: protein kinase [Polyangiales bacterium]